MDEITLDRVTDLISAINLFPRLAYHVSSRVPAAHPDTGEPCYYILACEDNDTPVDVILMHPDLFTDRIQDLLQDCNVLPVNWQKIWPRGFRQRYGLDGG